MTTIRNTIYDTMINMDVVKWYDHRMIYKITSHIGDNTNVRQTLSPIKLNIRLQLTRETYDNNK